MRKLLLVLALGLLASTMVGCIIPAYSGDPARRTQELIFTSEDFRQSSTNGNGPGCWISPTIANRIALMAA